MNNKTLLGSLFIGMLLNGGFASCGRQEMQDSARIELLDNSWNMNYPSTAQAELGAVTQADSLPAIEEIEKGFAIAFTVNLEVPAFDRHILEIPGILDVCLRQHNPLDRNKQNYPAYKMPDGSVPILEAGLELKSPVGGHMERMIIGIPLAMLDQPLGEHEVVLNFSGVRWTMYVDGKLLDNDFPIGYPLPEKMKNWKIDSHFVSQAAIYYPSLQPERMEKQLLNCNRKYSTGPRPDIMHG